MRSPHIIQTLYFASPPPYNCLITALERNMKWVYNIQYIISLRLTAMLHTVNGEIFFEHILHKLISQNLLRLIIPWLHVYL